MPFHEDECKLTYIGNNKFNAKYEMSGKFLEEVTEERDLGVIMQNDLKCSSQCIKAVKTEDCELSARKDQKNV